MKEALSVIRDFLAHADIGRTAVEEVSVQSLERVIAAVDEVLEIYSRTILEISTSAERSTLTRIVEEPLVTGDSLEGVGRNGRPDVTVGAGLDRETLVRTCHMYGLLIHYRIYSVVIHNQYISLIEGLSGTL